MKSILISLAVAISLTAAEHSHSADQTAVLAAVDNLAAAIRKGDAGAMGALLAEDLMYSHSNGLLETKAEAMKQFVAKKPRLVFEPAPTVTIHGGTGTVRGFLTTQNVTDGKTVTLKLNVLQVWAKMGPRWVLVARQSTRLNP